MNNKWQAWYDSLPKHTKEYIDRQAIWHDQDLYKAFAIGVFVGFLIAILFGR